jgi:sigma-B regulation protein RsbU (phosphoserine phosphatase)
MGSWPALLICYLLLDARLHLNFPEDLNVILIIILIMGLFWLLIGEISTGLLQRIGFKPWLNDFQIINDIISGTEIKSKTEYIEKIYRNKLKKFGKKSKNSAKTLKPIAELTESEKNQIYNDALTKGLTIIINFPRKYSIITILLTFLFVMLPGYIFTSVVVKDYMTVSPVILVGAGFFSAFIFISYELNTGPLRAKLKTLLYSEQNISRFSLRFKFLMQFIILILSLAAIFMMMMDKEIPLRYSIEFIIAVSFISVYLTYLYIKNILYTLNEIAAAVKDLGKGGKGKLYLSSLDKEFVILGNDFSKAADKVEVYRKNLLKKVNEKKIELASANKKLLRKNKTVQKELNMASDIQKGIFPKDKVWEDLRFSFFYRPMGKVSGDFFDVFTLPGNKCGILIADVSGHGVPAALITMMGKLSFSSKCQASQSPAEIFRLVNKDLQEHVKTQDYMTAFFIVIDRNYDFLFANAAHQKPIHIKKDQSITLLDTRGLFLGADEMLFEIDKNQNYEEKKSHLARNEKIVLFTDGIIDMKNFDAIPFGNERLIHFFKKHSKYNLEKISENFKKLFFDYIDLSKISDDITCLIVERS